MIRKAKPEPTLHAMSVKVENEVLHRIDRLKIGNRTQVARRAIGLYTDIMAMTGQNEWGLDVGYARDQLMHLVANLGHYTPGGFRHALSTIASGADKSSSTCERERINEEC